LLFVVTVHSIIPDINPITTHLSSFAIPLFFVLAGLTYNNDRYRGDLRGFVQSRGRQYLIPYFVLYTTMIGLRVLLGPYAGTNFTLEELLFWFAYGSGPPDSATHLWFLPVLFFGMVVFAGMDYVTAGFPRQSRWLALVLLPSLALLVKYAFGSTLVPWHANAILIAASFMIIGNEIRLSRGLHHWGSGAASMDCIGVIACVTILVIASGVNGFTDIAVDNLGLSVWLYMVAGTLGAIATFLLSSLIARFGTAVRKELMRIGAYSQEMYEIHPVTFYLVPITMVLLGGTTSDYAVLYSVLWPARLFLGVVLSLLLSEYVISRHGLTRLIFRGSSRARNPHPLGD